jgi:hypothetical protein
VKVIHIKDISKYDNVVYIGRNFKNFKDNGWGNPFPITNYRNREQSVEEYRKYIVNNKELLERLPELKDKTLACWCYPNACHGDVLVELVNMYVEG